MGGPHRCSATGTILLRINVYEVVGTGEDQHTEWWDFTQKEVVASYLDVYDSGPYNGSASTRWQTNHYSYWNGTPFNPYPGWSSVVMLSCGA